MKTILAAVLFLPLTLHAQVLVETVPERAKRCATMQPAIDDATRKADALIATEAATIADLKATGVVEGHAWATYVGDATNIARPMRDLSHACRVAAPDMAASAEAVGVRVMQSANRVLDAANGN